MVLRLESVRSSGARCGEWDADGPARRAARNSSIGICRSAMMHLKQPSRIVGLMTQSGNGIPPNASQKLPADGCWHTFRVSENVCHDGGLMTGLTRLRVFETGHTHQRRRLDADGAARIISNKVAGSGTAAFALAREPLPASHVYLAKLGPPEPRPERKPNESWHPCNLLAPGLRLPNIRTPWCARQTNSSRVFMRPPTPQPDAAYVANTDLFE